MQEQKDTFFEIELQNGLLIGFSVRHFDDIFKVFLYEVLIGRLFDCFIDSSDELNMIEMISSLILTNSVLSVLLLSLDLLGKNGLVEYDGFEESDEGIRLFNPIIWPSYLNFGYSDRTAHD